MRISDKLKIREIAGEKLVILEREQQVEFTRVMVLNTTSEWLWNQLFGTDFDADKVAALLVSKYEVEESVAQEDAQKWIRTLLDNNILN
ncbi:MAG TPA: PqqD family protein [Prolixibacteraceae bacterium]|nr:PqqD family protein [Prolixibacteraceae bacterium]